MIMMKRLSALFLVGLMACALPALAQEASDANMEILKQKLKADKKLLVANNMELSDAEAKQFWPVYESYQKDLAGVNKQLGTTIREYAETFNKGTIPNDKAK